MHKPSAIPARGVEVSTTSTLILSGDPTYITPSYTLQNAGGVPVHVQCGSAPQALSQFTLKPGGSLSGVYAVLDWYGVTDSGTAEIQVIPNVHYEPGDGSGESVTTVAADPSGTSERAMSAALESIDLSLRKIEYHTRYLSGGPVDAVDLDEE